MGRDRVIVVGAAGFLGRACTAALAAAGYHVDGLDVFEADVFGAATWTVADVMNEGVPKELFANASTLVHFAWRNNPGRGNEDMANDVKTNVASAVLAFEQAAQAGLRRIIYPSSGGTIYGKQAPLPTPETAPVLPVGGYGAGKAAAEFYLHAMTLAYGIETCALRIGNPYGPGQYPERGQGFIATAVARTLSGQPIQVFGSAELARDYVYIEDVSETFVLATAAEQLPPVLNVGSGTARSIDELIPLIFAAAGRQTDVEKLPGRAVDVPRVQLDISLIRDALGWQPRISIEEGMKRTVEWIQHTLKDR